MRGTLAQHRALHRPRPARTTTAGAGFIAPSCSKQRRWVWCRWACVVGKAATSRAPAADGQSAYLNRRYTQHPTCAVALSAAVSCSGVRLGRAWDTQEAQWRIRQCTCGSRQCSSNKTAGSTLLHHKHARMQHWLQVATRLCSLRPALCSPRAPCSSSTACPESTGTCTRPVHK